MATADKILNGVIPLVYAKRWLTFGLLMLATIGLFIAALGLKPDAGYEKQIPLDHPFMQVFKKYEKAFGGANLISIALIQKDRQKDIYNEHFLDKLKKVTDEVFFLPGVDRSRVQSLFTPGVRYVEIVEDGFAGGDVIPRNYSPSPETFNLIRANVGKAGVIGRLVSGDQRGALITAELLEHDPSTGERLDYRKVAQQMEDIRSKFQDAGVDIRIIGFAKVVGDVTDASVEVVGFFVIALVLTLGLLWLFCGSLRLSLLPLSAAITAVIWELGLLKLAGFGLDPFAILVPFLILSIGVSHGVQYINGWGNEVAVNERTPYEASVETFRRLFIPGSVAIITNVIGFATLTFIQIEIVQEMAINAALGMTAVIITNKVMLPIVLTWVKLEDAAKFRERQKLRQDLGDKLWRHVAKFSTPKFALPTLGIALLALAWAIWMYPKLIIGDQQIGVPELRQDSRYNQDSRAIAQNFVIGVDLLKVIAEGKPYGCVNHDTMAVIDRFAWHMQNTEGVLSVISLPTIAKSLNVAVHEGSPDWYVLPRNQGGLAHIIGPVPSSAGLQNPDCSVMPILIFTQDHRAETISRIIAAAEKFNADNKTDGVNFALASGNVGVMAATNAEIKAREIVVIVWVHLTLLIFVWISFRSLAAVVCIIAPLVLCSLLTYGGMATIGIGMKAATLPVAAFGVGIGVDDGIYLWSVLAIYLKQGMPLREAYFQALRHTGKAVVFTSLSLIVAVFTWLFSDLQFQADMGMLLLFMFTTNLFGAVLLLPALAWIMVRQDKTPEPNPEPNVVTAQKS
ncbi:efflux RND transporter permease subunit [Stenotrophobium rhamnosiphilum]|uniref:efflux RND transporter permease subunit n=1 Tax=Stenotrophobium rhamnosiphilum TaxID=2029166 RepID=UPI001374F626|nr:MMPL family transporter [Stenotrophobium rhamnosiphilum]